MSKPEDFVPYLLVPNYGIVMVEVKPCSKCSRQTLPVETGWKCPAYYRASRAAQMTRAGWVDRAGTTNAKGGTLCVECAPAEAAFKCQLCTQARTGDPEEVYGDPPEFLCKPCFETVPAKVWADKCAQLSDEHRHDFE